jgi:hypothetical protein
MIFGLAELNASIISGSRSMRISITAGMLSAIVSIIKGSASTSPVTKALICSGPPPRKLVSDEIIPPKPGSKISPTTPAIEERTCRVDLLTASFLASISSSFLTISFLTSISRLSAVSLASNSRLRWSSCS